MNTENKYLGRGLYSVPLAARLLRLSPSQIKRWVNGYKYFYDGIEKTKMAIFQRDLAEIEGRVFLSFLDLIELKFISAFREHGVSTRAIRVAAENVQAMYELQHPFCTRRFMTDGRTILTEVAVKSGDEELLDLVNQQYAVTKIFEPYLHGEFEFEDENLINRWWPVGRDAKVVIDPKLCFGQPIIDSRSIPTETLFTAFRAEGNIESVANWFECDPGEVEAAVDFETRLSA